MPKYLLKVSYTQQGIKGVLKAGGSSRADSVAKSLAGVGGSLESLYFAFGSDDVYAVAELPDQATAFAMAANIASSEAIGSCETVVLLTPAEVDAAMNIAVDYHPPGS